MAGLAIIPDTYLSSIGACCSLLLLVYGEDNPGGVPTTAKKGRLNLPGFVGH